MRRFLLKILCLASPVFVLAERVPDNVVVSEAKDVYTFINAPTGVTVKAVEQTQYEALRHSDVVVPHVYYNNVITLDKSSGGKAQHRNVNSASVFHDDSRVCFFDVELKSKGSKAKAEFRRTFKDAAFFAKVLLTDIYPVRSKTVVFEIPGSLPGVELVDRNFPEGKIIRTQVDNPDRSRTITYTISDMDAISDDSDAPETLAREPFIMVKGYFTGLDELHDYHSRMLDVDTVIPGVDELLSAICPGAVDRKDVISKIYSHVQQKVRYVAYEEGEAGYRPDQPAEVLRKQYGDCKGMAMLISTLLNRAGIEAYVASVGTKRIPFDIAEFPSLAATNHMICIAPSETDTLYLDATYEYISCGDIPNSIQGKDAMMFKGDTYEMVRIPELGPDRSSRESVYEYAIEDGRLVGKVKRRYKGDMLEMFMSRVQGMNKTYKSDALSLMVRPRKNVKVDKESIEGGYVSDGIYDLKADIVDENAVTDIGDAVYVDLGSSGGMLVDRVDLSDRRSDYELPFESKCVEKSMLSVPEGYKVGQLPEDFRSECGGVGFSCAFFVDDDGRICVEKAVMIGRTRVPLAELDTWNRTVAAWNAAGSQQIELLKK